MKKIISKLVSRLKKSKVAKKDDFAYFFHDATPEEKAEVIRRVMREATAEQEKVLREYRKRAV